MPRDHTFFVSPSPNLPPRPLIVLPFAETPWPTVAVLLVVAVAFGVAWNANRRGWFAIAAVLCLLLVPAVIVAERLIVTPAEQVEVRLFSLRDAVAADDSAAVLAFFSPTAVQERAGVELAMRVGRMAPDTRITDLTASTSAADTLAETVFRANGTAEGKLVGASQHIATRWRLAWRREAGEWKIYGLNRLHPLTGERIGITAGN